MSDTLQQIAMALGIIQPGDDLGAVAASVLGLNIAPTNVAATPGAMVPAVPNQVPTAMTPMEGPRPTQGLYSDTRVPGGQYAFDTGPGTGTLDMPALAKEAAGGNLTPEQLKRYLAARDAMTSAQENINEGMGITPSYNAGKRWTSPDTATNYPAW